VTNTQPELFSPVIGLGTRREEIVVVDLGNGPQTCIEVTPFEKAMQISNRVAQVKWTPEQQKQVDAAISRVAHRQQYFTADEIWAELGAGFPVTKGLAGRLNAAVRRKLIRNTGQISHANRGGAHDHAQRLTVWSLYGV